MRPTLLAALCAMLAGCTRNQPPSFVLVVLDTARADAISAYGKVAGTTPAIDALARSGLLYRHAYSNANWTLPAHASLFTGLLPSEHGVRYGSDVLPDAMTTLAEALRQRGYETVAFSENPWLGAPSRTDRGFDNFPMPLKKTLTEAVAEWLATRRTERPFFLFLNLMDPHWPYEVRSLNPFLPPGVSREQALSVSTSSPLYCQRRAGDPEAAILHGLYLGDVHAADAKLAGLLQQIERASAAPPVVIVTSDHGEYMGEGGLLEHGLGMGGPVLNIPLVVHGLPDTPSAVIDAPVQLVDLLPSLLAWAGAHVPEGLSGRKLPTSPTADSGPRSIVAEHWDSYTNDHIPKGIRDVAGWRRSSCTAADKVYGDAHAIIRFPHKLVWYAKYAPELFDVRTDPDEGRDLSSTAPEVLSELSTELQRQLSATPAVAPRATMDPSTAERLRALGYAVPNAEPDSR